MANSSTPTWRVTSQRETTKIGTNGDFTRGLEVTFQLASGTQGTVFVPESQVTTDRVRAMVADRADQLLAIERLEG